MIAVTPYRTVVTNQDYDDYVPVPWTRADPG
jgi:hypothetical protein